MIPNKEYWMGRALTREQEAYLRGTLLNKRMFNEYQKAADMITAANYKTITGEDYPNIPPVRVETKAAL